MVIRTQIQLEASQVSQLKRYSAREGISMAEAIRRCIDLQLTDEVSGGADWEEAFKLVGAFSDKNETRDLSRKHDDYLADVFK